MIKEIKQKPKCDRKIIHPGTIFILPNRIVLIKNKDNIKILL